MIGHFSICLFDYLYSVKNLGLRPITDVTNFQRDGGEAWHSGRHSEEKSQ